jgi:hypothetical protein
MHRPNFRHHLTSPDDAIREHKSRVRVKRLLGIPMQPHQHCTTASTDLIPANHKAAIPITATAIATASVKTDAKSADATIVISTDLLVEKKYGLGSVRSLTEWEQHIGIQFSTFTISERARFGGFDPKSTPFAPSASDRFAALMQLVATTATIAADSTSVDSGTNTTNVEHPDPASASATATKTMATGHDVMASSIGGLLATFLGSNLPDID